MYITHIAIWCSNLELMKDFYVKYFHAKCSDKYSNHEKHFESYFLDFSEKCKLELMHKPGLKQQDDNICGITHFALAVGSKDKVITLTNSLVMNNYELVSSPRKTGDGYFESIIRDPEGNLIEITI